ncbi:Sodium-coupled monocarboxylate transporter 2 [Eumeta japonica]|uniref:Sodium-coupled monocarboxylate transporter 2 n=1 Tax=Eumeta variegata TaxID=151549 RepID=A0A4C1T663_EUMVA|nr:Sodium-coupled monocarboxylate transporter 2 [Eumeta japonica]
MIQRYLSLPTLEKAQRAIWYFILGVLIFLLICGYSGLLIYATYSECDPLETKLAKRNDQLLPLLVMETLGGLPSLPGLLWLVYLVLLYRLSHWLKLYVGSYF